MTEKRKETIVTEEMRCDNNPDMRRGNSQNMRRGNNQDMRRDNSQDMRRDNAAEMRNGNMSANMSQAQLMDRINEVSFAVNDMQLYLDTHPTCERGMRFMREKLAERQMLLAEYARRFGPLTIDSADLSDNTWQWMEQPFPWQQEGGCR